MLYFIDGYNYLFYRDLDEEDFETSRKEVIEEFLKHASKFKIVVVFDAHLQRGHFSRTDYKGLEVVYTGEEQTADEYILEQVEFGKSKAIAVVSNDRILCKALNRFKVKTYSFANFFKKTNQKRESKPEKRQVSQFGSQEFKKYLKDFE